MPIREVTCVEGHTEEVLITGSSSVLPAFCAKRVQAPDGGWHTCNKPVKLVSISVTARSFPGADSWRR
jgi:hypothetical protein